MISVCIPIYNFDVTALVTALLNQIERSKFQVELILIDDHSSSAYRKINEQLCSTTTYIKLDQNIGRAKIRNLFLHYAKFEHLLFLDCDSLIHHNDYLEHYISTLKKEAHPVICGGRVYPESQPERGRILRWKYGHAKESKTAKERMLNPNSSFMTNNFLVRRDILETTLFDEKIVTHGHEDTLFGFELKQKGIPIYHIENPILNGDIDINTTYLEKMETGMVNLVYILNSLDNPAPFIEDVTVLRFYKKMKDKGVLKLIHLLFKITKSPLKFFLNKGIVDLKLFDFYKFGLLITAYKQHKTKNSF